MESNWYIIKVMPGKERKLNEQFNKEISLGKIENIKRFICPTEQNLVVVKNKKIIKEKVLYSGYLYFETGKKLEESDLKIIAGIDGIMGMMGDRTPIKVRSEEVRKILKDDETLKFMFDDSQKYWEFKNFDKRLRIPEIKIKFPYPIMIRAYSILVPEKSKFQNYPKDIKLIGKDLLRGEADPNKQAKY